MKKVVIVGGGISGLVANYVFREHRNADVSVIEPATLGGEFLAGGLKYIHRTDSVVSMLLDLGLVFSNYRVCGGIMLRGEVHPYPKCLIGMDRQMATRIQSDHYRKTRLTEPGKHSRQAMNDPASTKSSRAIRTDFEAMIDALAIRAKVISAGLEKVGYRLLYLSNGIVIPYDYLVMTIPLWTIRRCVDWDVPHGMAMKLNVIEVKSRVDSYARWDYVYTPYTPEGVVHRFSPCGASYSVEVNGELDHDKLKGDLNFIFRDGWYIDGMKIGLKGHLLPLEGVPDWPENVAPIGRFAKWDSRSTMDVALDDAFALAKKWM